jgi:hypothetical protein
MNKSLMGLAILPFLAGTAMAAQPLTDKQMDKVSAGHDVQLLETTNSTFVSIAIENPVLVPPPPPPPATANVTVGAVVLPLASMTVVWGVIP